MEPISTTIGVGLKLAELGLKLVEVIERAKGPRVELMVLSYLQVAQVAIRELGQERQGILSDASGCDIQDKAQVEALSERMRVYLQEDNVRDPLQMAIAGLGGCRGDIERAAQGLKWRKRNKQKAVEAFLSTLNDLNAQAQNLVYDFFPEYSGQGLKTLKPIFDLIRRIDRTLDQHLASDVEADEEHLAELVRDALRDPAQVEWIEKAANIERLVVELQLAFSVKGGSITEKDNE